MVLRRFVQGSTAVKVICLLLLLLFVAVCGLHMADAHHGADAEGLALANGSIFFVLLFLVTMIVARVGLASLVLQEEAGAPVSREGKRFCSFRTSAYPGAKHLLC